MRVMPFACCVIRTVACVGALPSISAAQNAGSAPRANQRLIIRSDSIDFGAVAVSPNGKWLALDGALRGRSSIWVVSASGGELHRITDGPHDDLFPVWFPTGDRLAFATNRVRGIMSVGIDTARGTALGPMKRISVEPTVYLDISPDGRQLVYVVEGNADGKARIRVAPATGGIAKTIYQEAERLGHPRFSSDGLTVFFSAWRQAPTVDRIVKRVSVAGGPATPVPMSSGAQTMAYPRRDRLVIASPRGLVVRTMAGDSITTLPVTRQTIHRDFSTDGRLFYQATTEINTTLRLVSTSGEPTIDLTSASALGYAYPINWTSDNRLFYFSANDRRDSIFVGAIGSQRGRGYSLTPVNPPVGWKPTPRIAVSGDGRYAMVMSGDPGEFRMYLLELETRQLTELTSKAVIGSVETADWTYRDSFYFFEQSSDGFQIKVVRGGEAPRLLAILPNDVSLRVVAAVGDRLLYRKQVGDSTIVLAVGKAGATPTRFASLPGSVSGLYPSPDGRWLAGTVSMGSSAGGQQRVMFLPLGTDGMPAGPPRFVQTDAMWDLAWTPDGRAVIGLEEEGMSARTRIRRIPVDPREPPTVIGPSNATFWDAYLSPDGKYVAIPMERAHGSTLWAFDLTAALNARR
jgi:Tol biopolymer transport system component